MPQTQSDFVVRVSTQGVEQAQRALKSLEQATTGVGQEQAQAFAAAASSFEKVVVSAERLCGKLNQVASGLHHIGKISDSVATKSVQAVTASAVAQAGVPAGNALDVLRRMQTGTTAPATAAMPSVGNALDVVRRMQASTPASLATATPAVGNALDVLNKYHPNVAKGVGVAPRGTGLRSAFGLGALQGMLPGQMAYVQRGPGAIAQMAGMSVGNMIGRTAMLPFSGAGGLAQVAGSVPLVGGLLSSSLSRYMGQADSAMSFRRQQMDLMPLLGSQSIAQSLGASPGARAATAMGPPLPAGMARLSAMDKLGLDPRTQYLASEGRRMMGADLSQVQGFRASLAAQGGGSDDQMSTAFIRAAMAAKTNLGVGPDVTGAFALGGRTNAFAGKPGADPAQMLMRAMGQADRLGLKGDDAQTYLREIAEGIKQFQQTGMPMQMDALHELTAGFSSLMGGNTLAAGRAAQGAMANSARFMQSGPQDAFDMQLMRAAGFTGGMGSYYKTKRKLGTDSVEMGKDMMSVVSQYARAPNEDKAVDDVMGALRAKGISISPDLAEKYVKSIRSGEGGSDTELAAAVQKAQLPVASPTIEGEGARASAAVPSIIAKQADMSTAAVLAGDDAASIVQNMEQTAQDVGNVFTRFGTQFKQFTGALQRSVGQMTGGTAMAGPPDTRPAH